MRAPVRVALLAVACVAAVATGSDRAPSEMPAPSWGSSFERVPAPDRPNQPALPWFQPLIDRAPSGSVVKPPPGNYSGPVVLSKPLTIEGGGAVLIDGGGSGTVLVVQTDGAVVRGLRLRGSGNSHNTDDACINVRGHRNRIEDNDLADCLFGIDLKQANQNVVKGNRIRSKDFDLGLRGDGLRLWYSMNNLIEGNEVIDSRDMVVWYSNGNRFMNNTGRRGRYSLHFMFANDNLVEGNRFHDNAVGVYLMYTEGVHLRRNVISHATGAAGMGIGFKEASDAIVEGNEILYCAVGIGSDLSPFQPGTRIEIRGNRIAYNGIALQFTSELGGNLITGNVFEGNLTDVAYSGRADVERNMWHGNYWDDYQGFDRDGDGMGDTPHELYAFADRIWMEIPYARFFKTSPVLEALDFLERLAPFSAPDLMLRDEAPRYRREPLR